MGNLRLFLVCVAIWGSTWLAIKFQLGRVEPEASVFYRFLLSSALIFAYCLARGRPLRYPPREHLWLALLGVLMFGLSYICVYYAERYVVSGLVAVGYSASPLLGMLGMRLFFGTPMTRRVIAGSILGMVGIALVFQPEFSHLHGDGNTVAGAIFTVLAVVVSTLGSLVAQRNHDARIPLWQGMAWGMLYGSLFSLAVALATGKRLEFELTPGYIVSLVYLAVLGSIIAFGAYLTLLKRVGAA
ncbi:MAG TPA: EamA family transporter, partial [Usitatibacter sp.]